MRNFLLFQWQEYNDEMIASNDGKITQRQGDGAGN